MLEVHLPHPQNGCQPTSQDGINLGSGAPEGKRRHGRPSETRHRTAEKEKTALGFTPWREVAVVVRDQVAW